MADSLARPVPPEATPAAAGSSQVPSVPSVLGALGGFVALGLGAGLGAGDAGMAARAMPTGLVVGAGALLLTGPALVVVHQFLGLEAKPDALVGALTRAFVHCGRLALGLTPFMLFFSATSGLWALVFPALLAGIGVLGHAIATRELREAEVATGADLTRTVKMTGLVYGWSGLTVLVALRIAWDLAHFVLAA